MVSKSVPVEIRSDPVRPRVWQKAIHISQIEFLCYMTVSVLYKHYYTLKAAPSGTCW